MRIVALEEHVTFPDLVGRIDPLAVRARGWPAPGEQPPEMSPFDALQEVGPERLADMDAAGVSLQVLSASGPGADLLSGEQGLDLARTFNDRLKSIVDRHPDRFAAFAHLPMASAAAADELERAVCELGFKGALINGLTGDAFLDAPAFQPLLACAERLGCPIYLHPNLPPPTVTSAYYSGLLEDGGFLLSTAGFGWHVETALHVLRLVLSGALDRHPKLKLIVGHMGETLPVMLDRADEIFARFAKDRLGRSVRRTILDQVWITTSGFFSPAPFMAAMATFGADRILFSVDYPFSSNAVATDFLKRLPVSPADRLKIASANADRLLGLPPGCGHIEPPDESF